MRPIDKMRNQVAEAFSDVLRTHRTRLGLTKSALSASSGLDETLITLYERQDRRPSLSALLLLAPALGMTPQRLLKEITDKMT